MKNDILKSATIKERRGSKLLIEVDVPEGETFLATEEAIMEVVNAVGRELTKGALSSYDADGKSLRIGNLIAYSKGRCAAQYQTPYGAVEIDRHVYQTSSGGRTLCPLEYAAKTFNHTTPKFAKQVSSKYGNVSARDVVRDLQENHGRCVSPAFVQDLADAVGSEIEHHLIDGQWTIEPTIPSGQVSAIACGLDGTMMPILREGYREAMTGTIAFYDDQGVRLQTFYLATAPEYGKERFVDRFLCSLAEAKVFAPHAKVIGLADGAKWNWKVLNPVCDVVVQDFYHASEYLTKAGDAMFPGDAAGAKNWLEDACHRLKHQVGGARRLEREMEAYLQTLKYHTSRKKELKSCVSYFAQGHSRMKYWHHTKNKMPIGSGVTEAACKIIVKQRMCRSGARWITENAEKVLMLRCMAYSGDQWEVFWKRR